MKILLVIILFSLGSCIQKTNHYKNEQDILDEISKKYNINSGVKYKIYIITGLDGCGACLDYTVDFIEKQSTNSNIAFIVSGQSRAKLKILFKYSTIHRSNFIRDTLEYALKKELIQQQNPKAFFCNSGRIIDSKDVTYRNADSVFNYVNSFLKLK